MIYLIRCHQNQDLLDACYALILSKRMVNSMTSTSMLYNHCTDPNKHVDNTFFAFHAPEPNPSTTKPSEPILIDSLSDLITSGLLHQAPNSLIYIQGFNQHFLACDPKSKKYYPIDWHHQSAWQFYTAPQARQQGLINKMLPIAFDHFNAWHQAILTHEKSNQNIFFNTNPLVKQMPNEPILHHTQIIHSALDKGIDLLEKHVNHLNSALRGPSRFSCLPTTLCTKFNSTQARALNYQSYKLLCSKDELITYPLVKPKVGQKIA